MIPAIRLAPTPLVSLPSPDLAGDRALFAAALAGLGSATAIGGEPRQAAAVPGNPVPVEKADDPGLALLRACDTATIRLPSPPERMDFTGRADPPPPIPKSPARALLVRPSPPVEPTIAADLLNSKGGAAVPSDGDEHPSPHDEALAGPDVAPALPVPIMVIASHVPTGTERAAFVATTPDAQPGRPEAPSFEARAVDPGAARMATRTEASRLAVVPIERPVTPSPLEVVEPRLPGPPVEAVTERASTFQPPMGRALTPRTPGAVFPDAHPAPPAPAAPRGDGEALAADRGTSPPEANRPLPGWAAVASVARIDQPAQAAAGPHLPEARRAGAAPPAPRPADAPPPTMTATPEQPTPDAIPADPAPTAPTQAARPFRLDLEPVGADRTDRGDAPTPDKVFATDPRRADVPAAPVPGGATRPAPLPTTGPAIQLFAAELRRAARDARPPAPLEALAPVAAIHPAAPTTDLAAPLDLRQEQWPGLMMERIERLRDAADAADTRIRLVPDALGSLDVSVKREGETVHVHFAAEQAATRALLQEAAPRLAEAAEARGLKLGQTSVDSGGADRGDRRQPETRSPAVTPARTAEPADGDTDNRIA